MMGPATHPSTIFKMLQGEVPDFIERKAGFFCQSFADLLPRKMGYGGGLWRSRNVLHPGFLAIIVVEIEPALTKWIVKTGL